MSDLEKNSAKAPSHESRENVFIDPGLPPDPDAGLSEEEKKRIVRASVVKLVVTR
jgi:hypothetical protein